MMICVLFGGFVGIQMVQIGQFVLLGDLIIEFIQFDLFEFVFGVLEEQVSFVCVGQKVQVCVGCCGLVFEGIVEVIDLQIDQ